MLLVQHVQHFLLVDDEHRAKRSGCSIPHAKRLTRQTTLAKEVARPQNCHDRLFATRTKRGNLHAARLYVHHAVGRASLRKDNLCSLELPDFFRHTSRIEKSVSIECVSFLGPSLELFVAALHKTDSMAPRKMKAQSVVFVCSMPHKGYCFTHCGPCVSLLLRKLALQMAFHIFTTQRASRFVHYDRIDDLIPCQL